MFIAGGVFANDPSLENYSTDYKLLNNVVSLRSLENDLVIYNWEWSEAALDLGIGELPTVGFIAQEVRLIYPNAIMTDANGYSMIDLPILIDLDDLVATIFLGGGIANTVGDGASAK